MNRNALLFFIAAASCSSHANAVELDAFQCTGDESGKSYYDALDDIYVCVNPTGEYASNYRITSFKDVSCESPYGKNGKIFSKRIFKSNGKLGGKNNDNNEQARLNSESLKGFKGRGNKQAAPNGMGFRSIAYQNFFFNDNRRIVCGGTAVMEYTEPCDEPCEDTSRRGRGLEAIDDLELEFETDLNIDSGKDCPTDIVLKKIDGGLKYPRGGLFDAPVNIISQDTESVTVQVKNTWDEPIDQIFYTYKNTNWYPKCFGKNDLGVGGTILDDGQITIKCNFLTPFAFLEICLQDTGLLKEGEDNAKVSPCCEPENSDDPPVNIEGPAVCYHLQISCESTCIEKDSRRNLRAIAA